MDSFYCIIGLFNSKISLNCCNAIICNNKSNSSFLYPVCFNAEKSCQLYNLLPYYYKFTKISLQHAMYIGKELYKAELALFFSQKYIQE